MQLLGATLLSRYAIERVLGSGGFGDTYLAKDTALPNMPFCVVKHLQPKTEAPEVQAIAQSLFEREAHMLYELGEHDSVPRLFAHFEQQGEFFLVQEFIEGHDLSTELHPNQPWPLEQVKALLGELLSILSILHQHQVIHRDIKPQNVMRRQKDGKLFLIDFGAVKEIPQLTLTETGATALTVAIGSPGYMPSEQAVGKPKPASDIYAVGMVAIQALTGQNPVVMPTDPNTGDRIWTAAPEVDSEFVALLTHMTHDHFSQRYQNAAEALAAFNQLRPSVDSTIIQAPIPSPASSPAIPSTEYQPLVSPPAGQNSRNWAPWLLSGGGLIALGAGLVMMIQPWNSSVQVTSSTDAAQPGQSSVNVNIQRNSGSPDSSSAPQPEPSPPAPVNTAPGLITAPTLPLSPPGSGLVPKTTFSPVGSAVVIDPPSNVRRSPNGEIICAVPQPQTVEISASQGDWYPTNFCGETGFIHRSQLSFNGQQALVIDPPSNVRSQPNGTILCAVTERSQIEVYDPVDGWYRTNVCQMNSIGYIHNSQISLD